MEQRAVKPYMRDFETKTHYGYMGELTTLQDIVGRPLKTGDTVELYSAENKCIGEHAVVKSQGKAFIMGIAFSCKEKGRIDHGWKVILKRRFTEVGHRETVGDIEYILE